MKLKRWVFRSLIVCAVAWAGQHGIKTYVVTPATDTVGRLNGLVDAQNAYDEERTAGCSEEDAPADASPVGKEEKQDPETGAEKRGDDEAGPGSESRTPCRQSATSIANRVALEALRATQATTFITWLAAVIAIIAALGALLSAQYAWRTWWMERDARRGRIGITTVVRTGLFVSFRVVNVGQVPILVHQVSDAVGNAYYRSRSGLASLDVGEGVDVTAPIVWPTVFFDVRYREYGGTERCTVGDLRPCSSGWVLGDLRERK